jgi:GNAT superfamily N-acetyltransferase
VRTTYLEQHSPADLRPVGPPSVDVRVERLPAPDAGLSRSLYERVGADWHWTDRAGWSVAQWQERLARPGGETWVARVEGDLAGYVELESTVAARGTEVEVAYFGLLPSYVGRGIGGHLLSVGTEQAWRVHERWEGLPPVVRVWLHTCSLDGPAALPNYLARGFRVFATISEGRPDLA